MEGEGDEYMNRKSRKQRGEVSILIIIIIITTTTIIIIIMEI